MSINLNPVRFSIQQKKTTCPASVQKSMMPITKQLNSQPQQQVSFTGFIDKLRDLINPPLGSYDKKIQWYINEAKLGNGEPLVRWVKEGLISSNEKNKKILQDTYNTISKNDGIARGYLLDALDVIEKNMKKQK